MRQLRETDIPSKQFEKSQKLTRPTLKTLLLAEEPRFDIVLVKRAKVRRRPIVDFER
jgi:hypothetical protein